MKNPVEEYLEDKVAFSFSQLGQSSSETAQKALLAGLGSAMAAGMGLAAQKIYDAATKSRDFRTMLRENPDVAEHHETDPHRVNLYYSSLRTMNPEFSKDPVIAGTYMRRMLENQPTAGSVAAEALGHQDKLPDRVFDAFVQGGIRGAGEGSKFRPQALEEDMAREEYRQKLQNQYHPGPGGPVAVKSPFMKRLGLK